uniref:SH3 domain-containing protein n=1 Tax=Loa loa TaxID=7209 RepID=A0A1I7V849_LOALO
MENYSDPSVLRYPQRKLSTPVSAVQRINRSWTPNPQRDNQGNSLRNYELQSRRSRSVGRYVESQSGLEQLYQRPSEYLNHEPEEWESGWRHELGAASCCPSSHHHYTTNCFAQQRSKTQHFHLPPYRFQQGCKRAEGCPAVISALLTKSPSKCLYCDLPCHSLSWSEIEYLYKTLDKKGIHMESFTEQLSKIVKSTAIGERLDQSVMYLRSLVDCLEACGTTSSNSSRRRSTSDSVSPTSLSTSNHYCIHKHLTNLTTALCSFCSPYTNTDRKKLDGQSSGKLAEIKKLAKYEVLIRQKVEKLSEELQQQRNRRHGYVPSASPALQKNFDRFSGLINEFGRSERATTPQTLPQTEITTCTALFSFKAVSPKELSFNRGDVIRVYRIIDMNWMEGEHNGQIGIFPSSYVQIDNSEEREQIKLVVLYPFSARNKNELSLKKGEILRLLRNIDANWIEGKNIHGQAGIFPKSYVREACDMSLHDNNETAIPDRPKTPRTSTTPFRDENPAVAVKTDHGGEMGKWEKRNSQSDFSGPTNIIPKNAETYRVLYAYKPRNADELELQENDIVFVIEKCDDGWFIGTLPRTGQFGTFPGNYVEKH